MPGWLSYFYSNYTSPARKAVPPQGIVQLSSLSSIIVQELIIQSLPLCHRVVATQTTPPIFSYTSVITTQRAHLSSTSPSYLLMESKPESSGDTRFLSKMEQPPPSALV